MNTSLSKSEAKSLGCEYYYSKYYLGHAPHHQMPWTHVGTDFHSFMEQYVKGLVEGGVSCNLDLARSIVDSGDYCDEARDLVLRYIQKFELRDPAAVIGAEQFLVIDSDFQPIRGVVYPGVGRRPKIPGAYGHGTLDLIERDGDDGLRITDWKTGFMPSRVDEYEPQHYALLALANFEWANTVTFVWDFVRFGSTDEMVFTRENWDELVSAFQRKVARRRAVMTSTEKPECSPMAGLCGYCSLACPLRAAAMNHSTVYRPIQGPEEAVLAASALAAIRSAQSTLEGQLRLYLSQRGALPVGGGNTAYLSTKFSPQISVRSALAVMGIEVPTETPQYEVDLDKLTLNASEFRRLASAKKRAGLLDTVLASAPTKARTELCIGTMPTE